MNIRKDFESAAPFLERLAGIGKKFQEFAGSTWPHMKSQEDFNKIYKLEQPMGGLFETLYGDGRDMAYYMSEILQSFNSYDIYPSMTDYVNEFDKNWCSASSMENCHAMQTKLFPYRDDDNTPWAVRRMIRMWDEQVALLKSVNSTVYLLKQTDIYRLENREIQMSDLGNNSFNIGSVGVLGNVQGSRVVVGSTDNSNNIDNSKTSYGNINSPQTIFNELKKAIEGSSAGAGEKQNLIQHVNAMEESAGKPSFLQRYQAFIESGAAHMTLLTPFIAPLSKLISP